MEAETQLRDRRGAYALLRLFLGVNIAMHGVSRLLTGSAFDTKIQLQFAKTPLPHAALMVFGATLPWAEAILGCFLVLGLGTRWALIGGSLVMALLTFGSGLVQDWAAAGVQLLYVVVYAGLLFERPYNRYSLDEIVWPDRSRIHS